MTKKTEVAARAEKLFVHAGISPSLDALAAAKSKRALHNRMTLDPNSDQTLKLGKYSVGLSQRIMLGVPCALVMSDSPATTLRIKRVSINAPFVGFASVYTILMANVSVTVGGKEDAYTYNANSFAKYDYPTIPPSQRITFTGAYHGLIDVPFHENVKAFRASFGAKERETFAQFIKRFQAKRFKAMKSEANAALSTEARAAASVRECIEEFGLGYDFCVTFSGPSTIAGGA